MKRITGGVAALALLLAGCGSTAGPTPAGAATSSQVGPERVDCDLFSLSLLGPDLGYAKSMGTRVGGGGMLKDLQATRSGEPDEAMVRRLMIFIPQYKPPALKGSGPATDEIKDFNTAIAVFPVETVGSTILATTASTETVKLLGGFYADVDIACKAVGYTMPVATS